MGSSKNYATREEIARGDGCVRKLGATEVLTKERKEVLEALWRAYREEERVWHQKSRVRWLKEGDRNTKYFHRVCKARTVRKNITQIKYEGRLLTTPDDIKMPCGITFKISFG